MISLSRNWLPFSLTALGIILLCVAFKHGLSPNNPESTIESTSQKPIEVGNLAIENVHDAGVISEENVYTASYEIRNTGDQVIELKLERTSCGCTHAELSAERIPPGDTQYLILHFDPAGKSGLQQVRAEVQVLPSLDILEFDLIALVARPLRAAPRKIKAGMLDIGESRSFKLQVMGTTLDAARLDYHGWTSSLAEISISSEKMVSDSEYTFQVELNPVEGPRSGVLSFDFADAGSAEVVIEYEGEAPRRGVDIRGHGE